MMTLLGNAYDQYRETAIETATPLELVVKLYEGMLRFTQRGVQGIERGDIQAAQQRGRERPDVGVGPARLTAKGEVLALGEQGPCNLHDVL